MDKGASNILKWSIENSAASNEGADQSQGRPPSEVPRGVSADTLRTLMGGPSDADLMKEAMTVIVHPEATMENKMTAFDNFEQLIENLDNANNMEPLGLWPPLMSELDNSEADLRKMAAWCVGTAVQNNAKSQELLLKLNGIPKICEMATNDSNPAARRKAVYALSSAIRNYQPAMNEALKALPKNIVGPDHVSASDMDVIDAIMAKLRESD